eukprot:TRINITY_DN5477_c0_g1_i4.p1 TRINITY_DN5477_c0_g1~~TRINITY_DN5477_c0_g1_i4.p1  ORF type:complete len:346 (-),score=73.87 TRINITY_DN5477_c0_g1_i4:177-1214(-)
MVAKHLCFRGFMLVALLLCLESFSGVSVVVSSFPAFKAVYDKANRKRGSTIAITLTSDIVYTRRVALLQGNVVIKGACTTAKKLRRCVIDGAGKFFIFPSENVQYQTPPGNVHLEDLVIQNANNGVFQQVQNFTAFRTTFQNNRAFAGSAVANNPSFSSLLIFDTCEFVNNFASNTNGGVMSLEPVSDGNSGADLKITNSIFSGNRVYGSGGAIDISAGQLYLDNVTFINNTADEGGAISIGSSFAKIRNCKFRSNVAAVGADILGNIYGRPPSGTTIDICSSSFEAKKKTIVLYNPQGDSTGAINFCQMKAPAGLLVTNASDYFSFNKWSVGARDCKSACAPVK